MAERGPVPKRSDQRRRANKPTDSEAVVQAEAAAVVEVPEADPDWHPVAAKWFTSLASSGQSAFYEPSDWAVAYLLAESISRELGDQPITVGQGEAARVEMHRLPPKGASLAAWLKGMSSLMATEGDRRRMRVELVRPQPDDGGEAANVTHIDDAARRLRGGAG